MSLLSILNSTADIKRQTVSASNTGGQTISWATAYSAIPITIQNNGGKIITDRQKREILSNYTAYTTTPLALQDGDKVVGSDGTEYRVVNWGDMGGRSRAWIINLQGS